MIIGFAQKTALGSSQLKNSFIEFHCELSSMLTLSSHTFDQFRLHVIRDYTYFLPFASGHTEQWIKILSLVFRKPSFLQVTRNEVIVIHQSGRNHHAFIARKKVAPPTYSPNIIIKQ